MSLFKGQTHSARNSNHLFVCNHPFMIDAGLGSFSLHSFREYQKSPFFASTVSQAAKKYKINASRILIAGLSFQQFFENLQEILGFSYSDWGIMYLDEYDKTSKKYKEGVTVTLAEMEEAADWYDTYVAGSNNDDEEDERKNFDKYVDRFSLSRKGYAELSRAASESAVGLRGEKGLRTIYIRFYINKKIKPDRVVANKGAPFYTDVPRRPTGPAYAARRTKDLGTGMYQDFDGIPDAYEPDDVVAAPLKTSFNPAIGMHDIQNQIIALLLDDLDPARVNNPNLSSTNIDGISFEDFYKKENPYYLGGYTSCLAIPLSSEYGNPHEFGPNQIKCSDDKVEKIRAVNRSARSFSKGQRVMCHYIGNEWIVTELGDPVESEPVKTEVGRWSFAKFITNTNTHFQPVFTLGGDPKANFLPYKPFEITRILRYQYYEDRGGMNKSPQSEIDEILAEGLSLDAIIHRDIIQTSIYDQYKLAPRNTPEDTGLIYTNNQKDGSYEIDGFTPLFFGPVFDDGHKAKILQDGIQARQNYSRPAFSAGQQNSIPVDSKKFIDGKDNNGSLPAEVAVNGPWSGESSPVDSYDCLWDLFTSAVPMESISRVIQNYNYWTEPDDPEVSAVPPHQSFAWPPANPSKVTFYSLTPQFAFADDLNATTAALAVSRKGRAFSTQAQEIADARKDGGGNHTCINGLGDALDRGPDKPDSIWSGTATQLANVEEGIYDPTFIFDAHGGKKWPLYDHYSKSRISEASLGLNTQVDYFTSTDSDGAGAEVCGVITARNKISRPQGGNLNIYADFHFGQGGTKIFGGTRVDGFNIFNMQIQQSATNPFGIQIARWGGRDNNIWDFGCTALHVKVYDWWPEDQTLFIAPYFVVLHFNPGDRDQIVFSQSKYFQVDQDGNIDFGTAYVHEGGGKYKDSDGNILETAGFVIKFRKFLCQEPETDVDMIVPTSQEGTGKSNIVGKKVGGPNGLKLIPERFSRVDTSRRGLLLTGNNEYEIVDGATVQVDGGIAFYEQSSVGLDSTTMIIEDGGSGFENGRYECGTKGAVLEVVTDDNGSITGASIFAENNTDPNLTRNGKVSVLRGEGYMDTDFPAEITIINPNVGGLDARITFENGIVYRQIKYDRAPRLVAGSHNGQILHPSTHKEGQEKTVGNARTEIPISDNSEYHKYPGQYECYYYFHNDVTHVGEKLDTGSAVGGALTPDVQYISINVT